MKHAEHGAVIAPAAARRRRRMTREPVEGLGAAASPRGPTKASLVEQLLTAEAGATLASLCEATGWQPHTCRAFLTRLRKAGKPLVRRVLDDGTSVYRMDVGIRAKAQ